MECYVMVTLELILQCPVLHLEPWPARITHLKKKHLAWRYGMSLERTKRARTIEFVRILVLRTNKAQNEQ